MNDIDRQAAELVMGYLEGNTLSLGGLMLKNRFDNFTPSTNILQALGDGGPRTIVGRMRELGWAFHFHSRAENREMGVGFSREWSSYRNLELYEGIPAAAITEAAVRAVKGDDNVR